MGASELIPFVAHLDRFCYSRTAEIPSQGFLLVFHCWGFTLTVSFDRNSVFPVGGLLFFSFLGELHMGMMSHLSDACNAFSSLCASFPLLLSPMTMTLMNQMTTVQGPGSLPSRVFGYVLNYLLIKSFDCCIAEYYLVESQYLQYFCSTFPDQKFLVINTKSFICLQ